MVKRIIGILLLILGLPCLLSAKEIVHVAILPFEVHVPEQTDFLRNKLPELLETQLSKEGISVVLPSPETLAEEQDISGDDRLRSFGEKLGADFVITGSFNRIGDRFSLDVKAVPSRTMMLSHHFYVEGEGLENLLDRVQELAKQISNKIFERKKIVRITIVGNKRIESEAIKKIIKAKEGGLFSEKELSDDLKRIHNMGYFDDIRVEATDISVGKEVTFRVKEKPIIHDIKIEGNTVLNDDKVKEALDIKTGSILNIHNVYSNIGMIEDLYKNKGYHNVRVTFKTEPLKEEERVDLVFAIEEGKKVLIKKIIFEGNEAYSSDHLEGLMETSVKGFFSWLTSSGELDQGVLDQDITKIAAYYHNNGYVQAKVGEPHVTYEDDWIYVTIKIEEGSKFGIGRVTVEGDLIKPEDELLSLIAINKEKIYNREVIRRDILTLTDLYSDAGYAFADIVPRVNEDPVRLKVDIAYTIDQGKPVYFEKIIIAGNTRTRDKVIRRELKVYEQELFSGKRLKEGSRNLYRLDYFEDIQVNTSKGSSDDKMNLHIDVKEKPTGAFSFGGGYSSVDHAFVMASISQRNLFGRGQTLMLKGSTGARTTLFDLSFTEPWLFDIPLSAGFDLYNTERDYDTYDKKSAGGRVRFGYPIGDYTRASFYYGYEQADIRNVQDDAALEIKEMEGEYISSSVTGIVGRDSRDRVFNPTEGSDNSLSIEWAGGPFGGDIAFTKYVAESGWYFPLFSDTVGMLHGKVGFVTENGGGILPVYERFFLGGMNSVRGFGWRDISPEDPATGDKIGGDKMIQFNAEFLFPLIKDAGLMGLLFFDAGQVYSIGDDITLSEVRESIGYGIRWYSPLGPMRLEYGYILDRKPGEGRGRWEFAIGTLF